jgi:hypothetical protein
MNYLIGAICAILTILCGITIPEIGNFSLNQTSYTYPITFRAIVNFFQIPVLLAIMIFQHVYGKIDMLESFKRLGYHGLLLGIFFGLGNVFFAETLLLLTPHLGISLGLLEAAMVYALSIFTGRLPFRASGLVFVMIAMATILVMCVSKYLANMDTLGNQQTTVFGVMCAILNNVLSAGFDYLLDISSETYKSSQIFTDIITQFTMYSLVSGFIFLFLVVIENFQGFGTIPATVWVSMACYSVLDVALYCSFSCGIYYTNALFMTFSCLLCVPSSFIIDYFLRGFKISFIEIICSTILLVVISCLQYVIYESQMKKKNTAENDLSDVDDHQNNLILDSMAHVLTPCSPFLKKEITACTSPMKTDDHAYSF